MLRLLASFRNFMRASQHVPRSKFAREELMMASVEDFLEIAVTGKSWMGRGTGSISAMIDETVSKASKEIQVAAYSMSENSMDLLDLLETTLARRIRVLLLVNRLQSQPDKVRYRLL